MRLISKVSFILLNKPLPDMIRVRYPGVHALSLQVGAYAKLQISFFVRATTLMLTIGSLRNNGSIDLNSVLAELSNHRLLLCSSLKFLGLIPGFTSTKVIIFFMLPCPVFWVSHEMMTLKSFTENFGFDGELLYSEGVNSITNDMVWLLSHRVVTRSSLVWVCWVFM